MFFLQDQVDNYDTSSRNSAKLFFETSGKDMRKVEHRTTIKPREQIKQLKNKGNRDREEMQEQLIRHGKIISSLKHQFNEMERNETWNLKWMILAKEKMESTRVSHINILNEITKIAGTTSIAISKHFVMTLIIFGQSDLY